MSEAHPLETKQLCHTSFGAMHSSELSSNPFFTSLCLWCRNKAAAKVCHIFPMKYSMLSHCNPTSKCQASLSLRSRLGFLPPSAPCCCLISSPLCAASRCGFVAFSFTIFLFSKLIPDGRRSCAKGLAFAPSGKTREIAVPGGSANVHRATRNWRFVWSINSLLPVTTTPAATATTATTTTTTC